jgi:hypothetical protein
MSISHTAHVTLNEPGDEIDLEAWLFGLSDVDYQACAKGIMAQACSLTSRGAA